MKVKINDTVNNTEGRNTGKEFHVWVVCLQTSINVDL